YSTRSWGLPSSTTSRRGGWSPTAATRASGRTPTAATGAAPPSTCAASTDSWSWREKAQSGPGLPGTGGGYHVRSTPHGRPPPPAAAGPPPPGPRRAPGPRPRPPPRPAAGCRPSGNLQHPQQTSNSAVSSSFHALPASPDCDARAGSPAGALLIGVSVPDPGA